MFRSDILPEAVEDLIEISDWYRRTAEDLPLRFQQDFETRLAEILEDPLLYAAEEDGLRRVMLRAFPYHIGFVVDGQLVTIAGVIHASRHPGVWKTRLP
jgi:plasmid stabilization system protein ParE